MLTTKSLEFAYTEAVRFAFPDLHCGAGEQCLILGKSGSGKTTLLHLLGGLLRGYKGTLQIEGQALNALSESELDRFRARHIGIVFQQSHLLRALTVEQNLLAALYLARNNQDRSLVRSVLDRLGLGHRINAYPASLSLGEQQRVAIARALVNKPRLVLADEPTSSLDDDNCREAAALLLEQSLEMNAALVVVTHDARLKSLIDQQITVGQALE